MLVYLHGLNSSSRSIKAQRLMRALAPHEVRAVDYPAHHPKAAVERLCSFFTELGDIRPAVIGSSMGGFYGQYLARRFAFSHLFMINPALTPWRLLDEHAGEVMTSAEGEHYRISRERARLTQAYGIERPCDGTPTTIFLNTGDEVIDYRIAVDLYAECGTLQLWKGGDHAFQHMDDAITVIRKHLMERGRIETAAPADREG